MKWDCVKRIITVLSELKRNAISVQIISKSLFEHNRLMWSSWTILNIIMKTIIQNMSVTVVIINNSIIKKFSNKIHHEGQSSKYQNTMVVWNFELVDMWLEQLQFRKKNVDSRKFPENEWTTELSFCSWTENMCIWD